MKMKAVQFTFLLLVFYCFESSIGVDEEVSASGMESGSSGSGDFLSDRDEEIRRISELQTSIPYKKLYNLKKCEDDPEADCEGLSQEKCLQEFNDMVEGCPWSCHFCAKEGEYTSRCEDLNNHCPSYAQRGDCQRLPDYMMQTCKKSCQFCGTESKDVDKHAVCPIWGREGYCQTDEDIRLACPHSCKKYKGVQPAPQSYPYPIKALHPYQYQAGQYPIPVPNPYPNTYPAPYPYPVPYPYPYPYPSHYPTQYPYPTPSPYPTPPAPTPAPYPTPPAPVPAPYPTPPAPVPAPYPTPPAPVPAPYPTPPAPVPAPYPAPPAPGPAPYPTPATPPAAPPPAPPPPYPVSPPPYPAAPPPPPPTYPAAPAPPPPTYPAAPAPPGGIPPAPTYDKSERERKQQRKHFKHKKYHSTEHKNKKHN